MKNEKTDWFMGFLGFMAFVVCLVTGIYGLVVGFGGSPAASALRENDPQSSWILLAGMGLGGAFILIRALFDPDSDCRE